MKVTQEKLPASQVGLEIEIAPEMTKQTYEQVIKKFAASVNIPGFRKGKVPRPILIQHLGTMRIKAAALEELLQNGIEKALEQEDVAGMETLMYRGWEPFFDDAQNICHCQLVKLHPSI